MTLLPSDSQATVRSIGVWNQPAREHASAGESIGLTFVEPVFVDRGDLVAATAALPHLDRGFFASCFWLSDAPPTEGENVTVQFGPTTARASVLAMRSAVDSATLEPLGEAIQQYALINLELRSRATIALDEHGTHPALSRFVLLRDDEVVAGGFVTAVAASERHANLHPAAHLVTSDEREARNGHRGAVIWLTGLSGSGKSTLAMELERRLFERGAYVGVLDGDMVRTGLSSDLGFSARDRAENIRRVGEVAAMFA